MSEEFKTKLQAFDPAQRKSQAAMVAMLKALDGCQGNEIVEATANALANICVSFKMQPDEVDYLLAAVTTIVRKAVAVNAQVSDTAGHA